MYFVFSHDYNTAKIAFSDLVYRTKDLQDAYNFPVEKGMYNEIWCMDSLEGKPYFIAFYSRTENKYKVMY